MVSVGAKEGGEGKNISSNIGKAEEEEEVKNAAAMDLAEELIGVVEAVKTLGEFQRTSMHKTESHTLLRRLKLLLPLLEEIRDHLKFNSQYPHECIASLLKLKKAFQTAKKLLKISHGGSKIYLALESESVMVRFHSVYEKLNNALEGMPYDQLGISEEVKEQVELMRNQLKRGKVRNDSQDLELTMDMMVVLSAENDRNADSASIERLANKLGLHTVEDLKAETIAVRKLVKERRGMNAEGTQQIVHLLNKLKHFVGMEEANLFDDPPAPKPLEKTSSSLSIPHEFLCPITLEIMQDPVIVATGQTYERQSIQQWLDSDHQTCPKTGQLLTHTSLAPNFALRNLIIQWCEKNNFQLPKKKPAASCSLETTDNANDEKMLSLVRDLSSSQLEVQRKAVTEIRMLSKECPENRVMVAKCGGIPPLVQLLSYPDSKIQEHAVTALLNLSIDESNKKLISSEKPIPAIIEILKNGTVGAKENSAAALFSLSMLDENKVTIGLENGIPPLVELLRKGTVRGKKDAVTALFNLTLNNSNKSIAVQAGMVAPLVQILKDRKLDMVDETLSILLLIASHPEGRQELGQLPFIETLVNLIKQGTPKNKECATAVLLELASNNTNLLLAALQYGVYDPLVQVANSGTDRGRRKANALLQLMSKSEQLFC